jgi:hypothetical protein
VLVPPLLSATTPLIVALSPNLLTGSDAMAAKPTEVKWVARGAVETGVVVGDAAGVGSEALGGAPSKSSGGCEVSKRVSGESKSTSHERNEGVLSTTCDACDTTDDKSRCVEGACVVTGGAVTGGAEATGAGEGGGKAVERKLLE